jgi:hypothetical protein
MWTDFGHLKLDVLNWFSWHVDGIRNVILLLRIRKKNSRILFGTTCRFLCVFFASFKSRIRFWFCSITGSPSVTAPGFYGTGDILEQCIYLYRSDYFCLHTRLQYAFLFRVISILNVSLSSYIKSFRTVFCVSPSVYPRLWFHWIYSA